MKKLLKWGLIAFIVLIVIGALSGNKGNNSTVNKATEQSNEQPKETMEVVAADFVADFDKNQLAAEEKYQGKIVKLTAFIKNISEDISGSPYISLEPVDDQFYVGTTIKCSFANKQAVTSLANGQSVTVKGEVVNQSLGIIDVKDCQIVD